MRDLDSYQVFCALQLLKNQQRNKDAKNRIQNTEEDEVTCACAKYLEESI